MKKISRLGYFIVFGVLVVSLTQAAALPCFRITCTFPDGSSWKAVCGQAGAPSCESQERFCNSKGGTYSYSQPISCGK